MVTHGTNKQANKVTGDLGERLVCKYLAARKFVVLNRNYLKPWGEIDIVASKADIVHFVEVKTVSYETLSELNYAVTHETWRPEEQVHSFKLRQIEKALEIWIAEHKYEGEYQIDVAAVRIVPRETYCCINFIEHIVI